MPSTSAYSEPWRLPGTLLIAGYTLDFVTVVYWIYNLYNTNVDIWRSVNLGYSRIEFRPITCVRWFRIGAWRISMTSKVLAYKRGYRCSARVTSAPSSVEILTSAPCNMVHVKCVFRSKWRLPKFTTCAEVLVPKFLCRSSFTRVERLNWQA